MFQRERGCGESGRLCLAVGTMLLLVAVGCARGPTEPVRVRVGQLEPAGVGARVGLEADDGVVSWKSGGRETSVASPLDLWAAELQSAPREPVVLRVTRRGEEREVRVQTGLWRVDWRLLLSGRLASRCATAWSSWEKRRLTEAARAWTDLAAIPGLPPGQRAWLWLRAGVAEGLLDRTEASEEDFLKAERLVVDPVGQILARVTAAHLLEQGGQRRLAGTLYERAAARCWGSRCGDELLAQALAGVARCSRRGDAEAAGEAVRLFERGRGGSLEAASARAQLARAAYYKGDFDAAEKHYREALEAARNWDPGGEEPVKFLSNIGLVKMKRGDLEAARSICLEALEEGRGLDPKGRTIAFVQNFLGLVARNMGRYEEARRRYEAALESFRRISPRGEEVAGVLNNLGNIAIYQGDLAGAETFHREALRLRQALDPGSGNVAASLNNLGRVAFRRGQPDRARRFLERAVALKQRLAAGTLWLASSYMGLADVARSQGRLEEARSLYGRALEIRRKITPGGVEEAEALVGIGQVELLQGHDEAAEQLWRRALMMIESCRRGLGLSEDDRAEFGAMFHWLYVRMAGILLRGGRYGEAFQLLERDRSRALRAAVGLRLPSSLPSELRSRWRRHGRAVRAVERRLSLAGPSGAENAIGSLRESLKTLEQEQESLTAEIREADPRFAALVESRPPTLDEVKNVLEQDQVLLEYAVGEQETLVMAVGHDGVEARSIPMSRDEVQRRVDGWLAFIERGRSTSETEPPVLYQAKELAEILVGPVLDTVRRARGIVVVPDDVLARLPFAALRVSDGAGEEWLGCSKSISQVPSAGVLVDLARQALRKRRIEGSVQVFSVPDPGSRAAEKYGVAPLEWADEEATALIRLFGKRAVLHHGSGATEASIRKLGTEPEIVHLSAHAVFDERDPMGSALLLVPSEDDPGEGGDGVLTAWEIMQDVHLDADLVTLSACGTARGHLVPGEGVMGLARAFNYAGARAVVASLWRIPDRSTCQLMRLFYANLNGGDSIGEALRRARTAMVAGPAGRDLSERGGLRHPYYWAGFTVIGDAGGMVKDTRSEGQVDPSGPMAVTRQ